MVRDGRKEAVVRNLYGLVPLAKLDNACWIISKHCDYNMSSWHLQASTLQRDGDLDNQSSFLNPRYVKRQQNQSKLQN